MTTDATARKTPWLPPRWFIHLAWRFHRAYFRLTGGRRGLWLPKPGKWGTMRVTTVGRKSGKSRTVILGYFQDGSNLVTLAMNGWGKPEPAWWLNLQARPEATVVTKLGTATMRGRAAIGEERDQLWESWRGYDGDNLDGWASLRERETAVVVFEPVAAA